MKLKANNTAPSVLEPISYIYFYVHYVHCMQYTPQKVIFLKRKMLDFKFNNSATEMEKKLQRK